MNRTFESGQVFFKRYQDLAGDGAPPFVRAASMLRVVDTARNWTVGARAHLGCTCICVSSHHCPRQALRQQVISVLSPISTSSFLKSSTTLCTKDVPTPSPSTGCRTTSATSNLINSRKRRTHEGELHSATHTRSSGFVVLVVTV